MSERPGVLTRLFARIQALFAADWRGQAGKRMRNTTAAISEFAEENDLLPREVAAEAVTLGRRKLEGLAHQEYAAAVRNFAETENIEIDTELKRRSLESEVRKKAAEARKAEIENLNAELELVQKLKAAGTTIHRDNNGHLTVLPAPGNFDYDGLTNHLLSRAKDAE
jgi:hypothetical protein